jgi:molecular chaperone GrpE
MTDKENNELEAMESIERNSADAISTDENRVEIEELDEINELEKLRAEADEYLDGWQRARAEFVNYKKRVDREQAEARIRITGEIFTRYLDIVDDLERALKERPSEGEGAVWSEGIELIYKKFMGMLEAEGVEVIPAEGQEFDPNFHEAVTHDESEDHEEGFVIEVLQPGYIVGERVLRPAMVRVAK